MNRDIIEHDFTMTVLANDIVTVTDPCYDEDTWCIVRTALPPGEYGFAVELADYGEWGERVCRNFMFRKGKVKAWQLDTSVYFRREYLGEVGVDAGLCGYFIDKPDFSDPQWMEFCEALRGIRDERAAYALPEFANGFFSNTGHGDGGYDVYLLTDRETGEPVGLSTVFIRDDEDEEEDEDYEDEEDEEED